MSSGLPHVLCSSSEGSLEDPSCLSLLCHALFELATLETLEGLAEGCALLDCCGEDLFRREGFANQTANLLESLVSAMGEDGPVSPMGPRISSALPKQLDLAGPSCAKLVSLVFQRLSRTTSHHWCHVGEVHNFWWIVQSRPRCSSCPNFLGKVKV